MLQWRRGAAVLNGIPANHPDRERVFDRFTRLDEARDRDAGGSGLGLAIVRELVHQTGGTVVLETGVAGGLAARVSLPVAPASGDPAFSSDKLREP